jgi:hypothetical protein
MNQGQQRNTYQRKGVEYVWQAVLRTFFFVTDLGNKNYPELTSTLRGRFNNHLPSSNLPTIFELPCHLRTLLLSSNPPAIFEPLASQNSAMSNTHASPTSTTSAFPFTMPPINRLRERNVHIYDAKNPTVVLSGLILSNGVTNTNFYLIIEILIIFTSNFFLLNEYNIKVENDNYPL